MDTPRHFEVRYPDTLIEIWKQINPPHESKLSPDEVGKAWMSIVQQLAKTAKEIIKEHNNRIDEKTAEEESQDAASDLLCSLMKKPLGEIELKTQYQYIVNDLRKQIAKRDNPGGHELSEIIREALRELEKDKVVLRDMSSQGKRISQMTSFKLASSPDRNADFNDYETNAFKISRYETEKRGDSIEHSRIITPQKAKKLIVELLEAFNGWITWGLLFKAALKHSPEGSCFRIVRGDPESDESRSEDESLSRKAQHVFYDDREENILDEEAAYEFYGEQSLEIIRDKTRQTWKAICDINGTKFFCLYHIPKHYGNKKDKKPVLRDFGAPQTMSDKDKKLEELWKEEFLSLPDGQGARRFSSLQHKAVRFIVSSVFLNLYRKCTENGYDPHLSDYEVQAEND